MWLKSGEVVVSVLRAPAASAPAWTRPACRPWTAAGPGSGSLSGPRQPAWQSFWRVGVYHCICSTSVLVFTTAVYWLVTYPVLRAGARLVLSWAARQSSSSAVRSNISVTSPVPGGTRTPPAGCTADTLQYWSVVPQAVTRLAAPRNWRNRKVAGTIAAESGGYITYEVIKTISLRMDKS